MPRIRIELGYSLEVGKNGYVERVYENGSRVTHHREVAAKALGRKLKYEEQVHHINGDKQNCDPSNLLICSQDYHLQLHWLCKALWGTWHLPSKQVYDLWLGRYSSEQRKTLKERALSYSPRQLKRILRLRGSSPVPRKKKK